jgi:hypothetical protein
VVKNNKKPITNNKTHDFETKSQRLVSDKTHHDSLKNSKVGLEKHIDSKHNNNQSKHEKVN